MSSTCSVPPEQESNFPENQLQFEGKYHSSVFVGCCNLNRLNLSGRIPNFSDLTNKATLKTQYFLNKFLKVKTCRLKRFAFRMFDRTLHRPRAFGSLAARPWSTKQSCGDGLKVTHVGTQKIRLPITHSKDARCLLKRMPSHDFRNFAV